MGFGPRHGPTLGALDLWVPFLHVFYGLRLLPHEAKQACQDLSHLLFLDIKLPAKIRHCDSSLVDCFAPPMADHCIERPKQQSANGRCDKYGDYDYPQGHL
jgi:hypothetical protein